MSLIASVSRVLSEPTVRERDLLGVGLEDDPLPGEEADHSQSSFIGTITGDLEARVVKVNRNTDQKLIVVTQDKALLCLKRNLARLGKREWIAPLSTVFTILISLITADFKTSLGLGPAEWKAMFIVSGFITTGWLAYTIKKALNAKTFHEIVRDVVYDLAAQKRYTP